MNQFISNSESVSMNQSSDVNVDSLQSSEQTPSNQQSDNSENFLQPDMSQKSDLLLGKFKSADELAKAYQEIQKQQGIQSKELGELRKKARFIDELQSESQNLSQRRLDAKNYLENVFSKYNEENYFKNDSFNSLFSEAFIALGPSLNMETFIPLLENYVISRINSYNKSKSAVSETGSLTDNMNFDPSNTSNLNAFAPLNSLSEQDLSLALDQLI